MAGDALAARERAFADGEAPACDGPAGQRLRVFDLHCDTLDRLSLSAFEPDNSFARHDGGIRSEAERSLRSNDCHLALDRMASFAWAQCFAVFIPDEFRGERAWRLFEHVARYFREQTQRHGDLVRAVGNAGEIEPALSEGQTAAMLTVEGAAFLQDSVEPVRAAADMGARMMSLVWNGENAVASGHDGSGGLRPFGRRVVAEMEQRRMVVDVSHLNDEGFSDLVDVATRPFAASHSNLRSVCGHRRNLTEPQLRLMGDAGCLVGLNFCREFLRDDGGDPTQDDVLRMVDRMLEVGGERTLALGSDYDGCDVPSWLDGCERMGALYELLASRFGAGVAQRIFFDNAHDFFLRNEG